MLEIVTDSGATRILRDGGRGVGAVIPPDSRIPIFRVLGTGISIVSMNQVLKLFENDWTVHCRDRYVVLRDVHGVMRARSDAKLRKAQEASDLTAPDGVPLVWLGKLAGIKGISRVCGPDLLPAVCERGVALGWRHYFFGGAAGVTEALVQRLRETYPGISIVGLDCPPFGPVTAEEDEIACTAIRAARPHFVWVGLGTPKQEIWMYEHRGRCGGATLLGVGAAFDIHAGVRSRAPKWMQRRGLEWLYRLMQDPKRLWARYVVLAPMFMFFAVSELLKGRVAVERGPIAPAS